MALRNLNEHQGIKVGGNNINNLLYVDDTVLIANSGQKRQTLLTTASAKSVKEGLELNVTKTECMVISKKANAPICNIYCNGERKKKVKSFKYLGYTISQNAKSNAKIKKRIVMAKETFRKMKTIFTNRNITMNIKVNTLNAYVLSVLLYGCESWTLNRQKQKGGWRLQSCGFFKEC